MADKKYELTTDGYHEVLSKPGEPLRTKTYARGEKVTLTDERAEQLIKLGAVKDPNAKDDAEPGAQTKAPGKGSNAGGSGEPNGTGATGGGGQGGTAS